MSRARHSLLCTVTIFIERAHGIQWNPGPLHSKTPNPYVVIYQDRRQIHRTRTMKRTIAPQWDERLTMSNLLRHRWNSGCQNVSAAKSSSKLQRNKATPKYDPTLSSFSCLPFAIQEYGSLFPEKPPEVKSMPAEDATYAKRKWRLKDWIQQECNGLSHLFSSARIARIHRSTLECRELGTAWCTVTIFSLPSTMSPSYTFFIERAHGIQWNPGPLHSKTPNLYVVIYQDRRQIHRTRTMKRTIAPQWDERLTISEKTTAEISLKLFHDTSVPVRGDLCLGALTLQLDALLNLCSADPKSRACCHRRDVKRKAFRDPNVTHGRFDTGSGQARD
ncbi:hypothetical protein B0H13DRAFT_2278405 [Mycena leptocephala]|nr:hypothetical protein B0H13DRAFT_2278405 [Mycena leptocephala]